MTSLPPAHDLLPRYQGVLVGCAVGDALGLRWEGMSAPRIASWRAGRPLKPTLLAGRGMLSDDTEHTMMLARSVLASGGDVRVFSRTFAWQLRGWLLKLPVATGLATGRAIMKLWLGFSPARSGIFSAGNGPAMRVALLGVHFASDAARRAEFVKASTTITHTDPKALTGALAIAETTAMATAAPRGTRVDRATWLGVMRALAEEPDPAEWHRLIDAVAHHLEANLDAAQLAAAILPHPSSHGVSGYMYHTIPMALFLYDKWFDDPPRALREAVELGGDTDTLAAIVGAMLGAAHGPDVFPSSWVEVLGDYPLTTRSLLTMAEAMHCEDLSRAPAPHHIMQVIRNIMFLFVVLAFGFRRLLPPYR